MDSEPCSSKDIQMMFEQHQLHLLSEMYEKSSILPHSGDHWGLGLDIFLPQFPLMLSLKSDCLANYGINLKICQHKPYRNFGRYSKVHTKQMFNQGKYHETVQDRFLAINLLLLHSALQDGSPCSCCRYLVLDGTERFLLSRNYTSVLT